MNMILDTDILSMLGKIGRASLLKKLFPESDLAITFEVYNEILIAKELGYDFVDDILNQQFKIIHLDPDLTRKYELLKGNLANLHPGELTSILICKKEGRDFATNDKKAKIFCNEVGVSWVDIADILRLCFVKQLLERKEIELIISEIEEHDKTRIVKTEEIFNED